MERRYSRLFCVVMVVIITMIIIVSMINTSKMCRQGREGRREIAQEAVRRWEEEA